MSLIILLLILILVLILNKNRYEGFEGCNYRKKGTGKMCNEKWGEPQCNPWSPIKKLKNILSVNQINQLNGYQSNPYSYELGYQKKEGNIPRGINSTFF